MSDGANLTLPEDVTPHPLRDVVTQLEYAGRELRRALEDPMVNERTVLEIAMMTLGSLAEEAGRGDDVVRWCRTGVEGERDRQRAAASPPEPSPRYRVERLEGPARRVIDRATNAAVVSFHAGLPLDQTDAAEAYCARLNDAASLSSPPPETCEHGIPRISDGTFGCAKCEGLRYY